MKELSILVDKLGVRYDEEGTIVKDFEAYIMNFNLNLELCIPLGIEALLFLKQHASSY